MRSVSPARTRLLSLAFQFRGSSVFPQGPLHQAGPAQAAWVVLKRYVFWSLLATQKKRAAHGSHARRARKAAAPLFWSPMAPATCPLSPECGLVRAGYTMSSPQCPATSQVGGAKAPWSWTCLEAWLKVIQDLLPRRKPISLLSKYVPLLQNPVLKPNL